MTALVQELQLPEGYTVRKCGNSLKVVVKARQQKVVKEERKDMIIERTLRPYGCHSEELAVGRMVNGEFKVERGIWNVTKDARLKVARKYEGRGAQTDVHYTVGVPADYPLVIAKKRKVGHGLTSTSWEYETLYTPVA